PSSWHTLSLHDALPISGEAGFWILLGVFIAHQPTAGRCRFRLCSPGQKTRQITPGERAVTSWLDELADGVGDSLCRDAVLLVEALVVRRGTEIGRAHV